MEREEALNTLQLVLVELEYAIADLEWTQEGDNNVCNDGRLGAMLAILSTVSRDVQFAIPISAGSIALNTPSLKR